MTLKFEQPIRFPSNILTVTWNQGYPLRSLVDLCLYSPCLLTLVRRHI